METKEKALKLANDLEELHEQDLIDGVAHLSMPQASAMIRRLVEELDKQTKPTITKLDVKVVAVTMTDDEHRVHEVLWEAPKPLSDEEIEQIAEKYLTAHAQFIGAGEVIYDGEIEFARAIEERHGIK